jgi:hypothetical protein|nr:MAG TPA: hypothetical protein [Crassvirales sp.]
MKKYTIEATKEQLEGIAYACQITDRLILGQLSIPLQDVCLDAVERRYKGNPELFMRNKIRETSDIVNRHIQELQELCWGLKKGEYNGVGYDEYADMLFDIQKVIEHSLWLEKPNDKKNYSTNDAFPPKQYGEEPLITIKSKEV